MKKVLKWVLLSASIATALIVLAIPIYFKMVLGYAEVLVHEYEMRAYVLFTIIALLIGCYVQKEFHRRWAKILFIILYAAFMLLIVFTYNIFLKFVEMQFFYENVLGWNFISVLINSLKNKGGSNRYMYILYFLEVLSILSISIILVSENTKNRIVRMIWHLRVNRFIGHTKRNPHIMPGFVMLDAPSGFGKTHYVKKFMREWNTSMIKVLSGEEFIEHFYRFVRNYDYNEGNLPMSNVFGESEVVIIKDIDMVLTGGETTQEGVAHVFMKAIEQGIRVIVTGINIADRAPFFYWKMTCMCDHKYYIA